MAVGVPEPRFGGVCERGRIGVVRAQQDRARPVANHVGQVFLVLRDAAHPAGGPVVVLGVDQLDHRERQYALGGLLQRTVEDLVELMAHHDRSGDDCSEPQRGHPCRQAEREPAAQAVRRHRVGHLRATR